MEDFINSFRRYCGGSTVLASLIAVNILIFIGVWIAIFIGSQFGMSGNFTMQWLCVPAMPEAALRHPWTLLTYMVTQYDFIHLLFNVLWLFWFGVFIPFWVSERKRLLLYVGGGIAGALLYVGANAFLPGASVAGGYLCGASAAVLAIMAAVAIWEPRREIRLFFIGSVQMKWVAIVCIALTLFGFNSGSGAAQSAHVGGALFGIAYALLVKMRSKSSHPSFFSAYSAPRRRIRIKVHRNGKAVADAAAERLSDAGRLDQLLDKIRLSGYSSLSAGERNELNLLSQRIDKNNLK